MPILQIQNEVEKKVELEDIETPFKKKKKKLEISLNGSPQKDRKIPEDLYFIHSALSNFDCKPEIDNPGPRTTRLLEKKQVIDTY